MERDQKLFGFETSYFTGEHKSIRNLWIIMITYYVICFTVLAYEITIKVASDAAANDHSWERKANLQPCDYITTNENLNAAIWFVNYLMATSVYQWSFFYVMWPAKIRHIEYALDDMYSSNYHASSTIKGPNSDD